MGLSLGIESLAMGPAKPHLTTVEKVDLGRYLGKWYEVARLPQRYEKDCIEATAEYRPSKKEGKIAVRNSCRKLSCDSEPVSVEGTARVVDPVNFSKLKVSFFWPFEGDYWILKLHPNYEYAVVGAPSRKALWILSRTPHLDPSILIDLLSEFSGQGFPTERMIFNEICE